MKGSAEISAPTKPGAAQGDSPPPSPAVKRFGLTGPAAPLDPAVHAYRPDIADIALAGQVVASHYAQGVERALVRDAKLLSAPGDDGEMLRLLEKGELFALLDCDRGRAWGYALADHRVGYVDDDALS